MPADQNLLDRDDGDLSVEADSPTHPLAGSSADGIEPHRGGWRNTPATRRWRSFHRAEVVAAR